MLKSHRCPFSYYATPKVGMQPPTLEHQTQHPAQRISPVAQTLIAVNDDGSQLGYSQYERDQAASSQTTPALSSSNPALYKQISSSLSDFRVHPYITSLPLPSRPLGVSTLSDCNDRAALSVSGLPIPCSPIVSTAISNSDTGNNTYSPGLPEYASTTLPEKSSQMNVIPRDGPSFTNQVTHLSENSSTSQRIVNPFLPEVLENGAQDGISSSENIIPKNGPSFTNQVAQLLENSLTSNRIVNPFLSEGLDNGSHSGIASSEQPNSSQDSINARLNRSLLDNYAENSAPQISSSTDSNEEKKASEEDSNSSQPITTPSQDGLRLNTSQTKQVCQNGNQNAKPMESPSLKSTTRKRKTSDKLDGNLKKRIISILGESEFWDLVKLAF